MINEDSPKRELVEVSWNRGAVFFAGVELVMADERLDAVRVRVELARICRSPQFSLAGRLRDFLCFIVAETLASRQHLIKEYSIGTLVYARGASFDPKLDSIVRVEAIKLRTRLSTYYAREGLSDELVICVPKGGYVPEFHNRGQPLVHGTSGSNQLAELCDVGSLALMRRTPAAISVATSCFVQAATLNPTELRAHLGLATSYTASLDIETVSPQDVVTDFEAAVSRALRLNEGSSEVHVLESVRRATMEGVGTNAVEELARAIDLEPQSPVAHFWATALLSAQGAHESSLEHFRKAIRLAPDCPLIRAYLGRSLYYAGRNRDALDVLQKVLSVDPGLAMAHLWAALVWTELGGHDEAIEVAFQAVQLSETSATLSVSAFVLARGGRLDEAEDILGRLTTDPPYGYVSPLQLAVISDALNRKQEAAMRLASARRENAWALLWQEVDPRVRRLCSSYR
jgi:tetratricopeptide (TPR) repeat protein